MSVHLPFAIAVVALAVAVALLVRSRRMIADAAAAAHDAGTTVLPDVAGDSPAEPAVVPVQEVWPQAPQPARP